MMVALLTLALAAAAPEPAAVRLQALSATSGDGAETLLDGDPASGWTPEGDPAGEGVLLRFESPVAASAIDVAGCGAPLVVDPFVNGKAQPRLWVRGAGAHGTVVLGQGARIQSVFLKLFHVEKGGRACLGEVAFRTAVAPIRVEPPRWVRGRVTATSTLAPAPAYHPSYLFDMRTDFGWAEGAPGRGEGEAIALELDAPVRLTGLELWNGYQRSKVHFEKNGRARAVTVSIDDGPPRTYALKDAQGPQRLLLPAPVEARKVRLSVAEVYPGTKYPDLVLSELRLLGVDGPVGVRTPDRDALRRALVESVASTALARMLGVQLDDGCSDRYTTRTLKLRPDHTFVTWSGVCNEEGGVCGSEVFDGTWVVTSQSGAWTEIELFGRRHRVDESWDPYGDDPHRVRETDAIAGGRVRIAGTRDLSARERAAAAAVYAPPEGTMEAAQWDGAECQTLPPETERFYVQGPALQDVFVRSRR